MECDFLVMVICNLELNLSNSCELTYHNMILSYSGKTVCCYSPSCPLPLPSDTLSYPHPPYFGQNYSLNFHPSQFPFSFHVLPSLSIFCIVLKLPFLIPVLIDVNLGGNQGRDQKCPPARSREEQGQGVEILSIVFH